MEINVGVLRDSLARTGLIACAWRARVLHAVGIARERILAVLVPPTAARHRLESRDGDGRASLHLGLVGPRRVENNVRVFPVVPDMSREGARQYHRCPADDEEIGERYVPVELWLRDADAATTAGAKDGETFSWLCSDGNG